MKNIYVHDLLKSVETKEYAVDLIKRVKEMCTAGGFNLTKSICNRKNVLISIHDIHNSTGAEMENQYRIEKGDDVNKIKKSIRFFC